MTAFHMTKSCKNIGGEEKNQPFVVYLLALHVLLCKNLGVCHNMSCEQ